MNRIQQRTWAAFCKAPTEENFRHLYDETSALVHTLCRRILRDEESARDAFQGTYCRLLATARELARGGNVGDASALVYRLTVREADAMRQRHRRRSRKEVLVGSHPIAPDSGPRVDEIVAGRQVRDRVECLVAALPDKYRIPVALHYFDGLTHQEISSALGLSRSSVSGRIARALRKLEPALRGAGLGRAAATFGALLATCGLVSPPPCFSADSVFSQSVQTLAASAVASSSSAVPAAIGTTKAMALAAVGVALVGMAAWLAVDRNFFSGETGAPDGDRVAVLDGEAGDAGAGVPAASVEVQPGVLDVSETATADAGAAQGKGAADSEALATRGGAENASEASAGTSVFGKVIIQETGEPAAGAEVVAIPEGKTAVAGEDGSFQIANLSGAQVGVGARLGAYVSHLRQQDVELAALEKDQRHGPLTIRLIRGLTLSGTIRNDETGRAVEGVTVSIPLPFVEGMEATTDASGRFTLEGLLAMQMRVDVRASGYAFARVLYELSPSAKNTCDFELEPEGVADIRVFDTKGKPLDDVRVAFFVGGSFLGWKDENRTDAEGRLVLHGLSVRDPPRLALSKDGYRVVGKNPLAFAAGEHRTFISFLMREELTEKKGAEKAYAFSGRVVDGAGKPLEDLSVRWSEKRSPNQRHETTRTDAEGRYRLGVNKTDGDRQLSAFGKGWAVQCATNVTPGSIAEPAQVDFTMKLGHRIEAVVVDESGLPVSGVMVCLLLEGKERNDQREIAGQPSLMKPKTTGADGLVRLDGLPDGDVFLRLWRHGFSDINRFDVDSDAKVRIEMKTAGVIKARAVDAETGDALTEFTAKVGGYGVSVTRSNPGQRFSTVDGRFVIGELDQGRSYRVTIEAPGYPPTSERRIGAYAPDADREEVIRLVKASGLSGVVTSAESGRPVPGASVALAVIDRGMQMHEWSRLRGGQLPRYEHLTLVETDEAGVFEVDEGEEARTLFIRCPGFARRVIRPEDRRLFMTKGVPGMTIPLEPAAALAGAVFRRGEALPYAQLHVTLLSRPAAPFTETMESIHTDASGEYSVEDLAAGTYRISVYESKDNIGFAWIQRRIDLESGQERELRIGHDLGSLVLHGRVLGADGAPVEHARVRAAPKFSWHYGELVTYTGRDGRYRLDGLRAGLYAATASKSFHPPRGTYYTLQASDTLDVTSDTERDFAFRKQHRITAQIDFDAGLASSPRMSFSRAYLQLENDGTISSGDEPRPVRSAHCEIRGDRLEFKGWFEGDYELSLNGSTAGGGFARYEIARPCVLDNTSGDQDIGVIAVAAPGDSVLEGTVVDAEGSPVEKAVVTLTPAFGWKYRWFRADADRAGRFRVERLRDGRYTANVNLPRSVGESRHGLRESVEIGGSTTHVFRFPAEHSATVRFRWEPGVSDETRSYFVRAMLERVEGKEQAVATPDGILQSLYADIADDKAEFRGRLSGEYLLRLVYNDGESGLNVGMPVAFRIDNRNGDHDLGAVEVPAANLGSVTVRLKSAEGELPRYGTVYLFPDGNRQQRAIMGATLEKGELNLPAVRAGTYEVSVAAFGFRCEPPLSGLSVAAGETAEARFELVSQGAIKGRARAEYESHRPLAVDRVLLRGPGGIERVLRPPDDVNSGAHYTYELAQEDGLFGDRFVFARLDRGTYEITVEAEGFEVERKTVAVEPGRDQHLWLGLRPSAE